MKVVFGIVAPHMCPFVFTPIVFSGTGNKLSYMAGVTGRYRWREGEMTARIIVNHLETEYKKRPLQFVIVVTVLR